MIMNDGLTCKIDFNNSNELAIDMAAIIIELMDVCPEALHAAFGACMFKMVDNIETINPEKTAKLEQVVLGYLSTKGII